jgi:GH35 family endo-1,4-beta-xylanase
MLNFVMFETSPADRSHGEPGLRHAHMFGADDIPLPAEITLVGGVIRCEKRSAESAGLELQFNIDAVPGSGLAGIGPITIQTCLLPDRDKPYLLSLELARHRLMLILNKLEDWALFDLPPADPGLVLFERARQAFTQAVVEQGISGGTSPERPYTHKADALARQALALAMEASESLTLTQARVQFSKRMSGELAQAAAKISAPPNALTDHEMAESRNALLGNVGVILPTPAQVGAVVSADQFTPALQKAVQTCCDFVTMPLRWVDMEPTEGRYVFSKTDRWIEWAVRSARLPIVAGPVIDLRKGNVPEWLYIWEHDYETLRELVYEHVKNLVTRYRRTVTTWTVVSGLHVSSNFTLSLEQVMDLTRLAVMVVRKLQPSAKVQVQIDHPWGEYFASSATRAMPPMMYAEMIGQAGINPDLFALCVEMGQPEPGRSTRDLMAFSALLDRFAALEKPLAIAALSAPSTPPDPDDLGLSGEHDPGHWRKPWSPQAQAAWMTKMFAVAASKPYVHSIAWHEMYDAPPDAGGGAGQRHDGLFDGSLHPKPALWRLAEIRQAILAKQSPANLPEAPIVGSM